MKRWFMVLPSWACVYGGVYFAPLRSEYVLLLIHDDTVVLVKHT